MKEEIVTANELAEKLHVKPETVRIWARQGIIPSLRPTPKVLRFEIQSVLEAIKNITSRKEIKDD